MNTGLHEATLSMSRSAGVSEDDVITKLAMEIARRQTLPVGAQPPPPESSKTFLGIKSGGWTRMLLALIVALLMGVSTWVLFVRDDLKTLHYKQRSHEISGHEESTKDIGDIKKRVGKIESVQSVQAEKLTNIDEGIGEIKRELRRR